MNLHLIMNLTMKPDPSDQPPAVGDVVDLEVGAIVHGGHCIAHSHGATFFVRGALPGERVKALIRQRRKSIYFADSIEVLLPSEYRVTPPCVSSLECGGCDFQHVDVAYQRSLKTKVLIESLERFSGLLPAEVNELVGKGVRELMTDNRTGLNWRTRARFVWSDGWNMHGHRSDAVIPTPSCRIITEDMREALTDATVRVAGEYHVAQGTSMVSIVGPDGAIHGGDRVAHEAFGSEWRIPTGSFWQAHAGLIPAIGDYLDSFVDITRGETWWDLFGGSGVFSAYLWQRLGGSGRIYCVEGCRDAVQAGKRALHDKSDIYFINSDVSSFVAKSQDSHPDGVLLDPPRSGAGIELCRQINHIKPHTVIYIACDPVALARDINVLSEVYRVTNLASWDAFPMSHHFETVAVLTKHLS